MQPRRDMVFTRFSYVTNDFGDVTEIQHQDNIVSWCWWRNPGRHQKKLRGSCEPAAKVSACLTIS